MKLLKTVLAHTLVLSIVISMMSTTASAQQVGSGIYSANRLGDKELTWISNNERDILTAVTSPEQEFLYKYDSENRRISKDINGVVTTFAYDD